MGQSSGAKTIVCRFCGKTYRRTNWMRRINGGTGPDGKPLRDTHEIACARAWVPPAVAGPDPGRPEETQ